MSLALGFGGCVNRFLGNGLRVSSGSGLRARDVLVRGLNGNGGVKGFVREFSGGCERGVVGGRLARVDGLSSMRSRGKGGVDGIIGFRGVGFVRGVATSSVEGAVGKRDVDSSEETFKEEKQKEESKTKSSFPETSSKVVGYWLIGSAVSCFGIVVFGGLTRLTESGYVTASLHHLYKYHYYLTYS